MKAQFVAADSPEYARPDSFIYFVREDSTGSIKIGSAANPRLRLGHLQIGNSSRLAIVGLMAGGPGAERDCHDELAGDWLRGEWFAPGPSVVGLILAQARGEHFEAFESEWPGCVTKTLAPTLHNNHYQTLHKLDPIDSTTWLGQRHQA